MPGRPIEELGDAINVRKVPTVDIQRLVPPLALAAAARIQAASRVCRNTFATIRFAPQADISSVTVEPSRLDTRDLPPKASPTQGEAESLRYCRCEPFGVV